MKYLRKKHLLGIELVVIQLNKEIGNPLLYKKVGVDGVKTGYLAVEKYSLASSMKKNDRRLIAVASGFQTKNLRSSESLKLLNWGFRNTNTFEITKKDNSIFELET